MKLNFDFLAGYKTKISMALFVILFMVQIFKNGLTKESMAELLAHEEIIIAFLGIMYGLFMKLWRNNFDLKTILSAKNSFQKYSQKMLGKSIDYDNAYGDQCVDLAKDYAKNVLGVSLGSFGGSAKTGWANLSNTFRSKQWEKIENNYKDKKLVPKRGDIIFFDGGDFHPKYGHVAIVSSAIESSKTVEVLEQNGGSGDGSGKGKNAIRFKNYSYTGVAGWYRKIG